MNSQPSARRAPECRPAPTRRNFSCEEQFFVAPISLCRRRPTFGCPPGGWLRIHSPKHLMKLPLRDPICLAAWGAYCLNRFLLAPQFGADLPFLREHFNDSLLIPAALPLLYWARARAGLRADNAPPTLRDIMLWCAAWSLVFEFVGPRIFHRSVGDWGDVAAYFAGGLIAALWWNWPRKNNVSTTLTSKSALDESARLH